MDKIINEITNKSNQANLLLRSKNNPKAQEFLKDIYTEIKNKPDILNFVKDYESLAYSFLLMYMDKTYNQTELKKIIELAYTCVSLAINKNKSKPYNLRIAILKHGENVFIDNIIDFWELKGTSPMYQMTAIMLFNNLLVADIESTSKAFLVQPFFKKLNQQLEEAINSGVFDPVYSRTTLADRGLSLHEILLENLMELQNLCYRKKNYN